MSAIKEKIAAYDVVMKDIQSRKEVLLKDGLGFEAAYMDQLLISLGRLQSQVTLHELMVQTYPESFPKEDPTAVEVLY